MLPVWPRRFSESLAYSGRFQRGDTRPGHYAGTIYCFVMQGSTICHNMQVRSRQQHNIANVLTLTSIRFDDLHHTNQAGIEQQSTKAAPKAPPAPKAVSPVSSPSEAKDLVAKAKREADEILKQARSAGASLLEVGWCACFDILLSYKWLRSTSRDNSFLTICPSTREPPEDELCWAVFPLLKFSIMWKLEHCRGSSDSSCVRQEHSSISIHSSLP